VKREWQLAQEEHGAGGIAEHLNYWTYKFDDSNPFMQIHLDTMLTTVVVASLLVGFPSGWVVV